MPKITRHGGPTGVPADLLGGDTGAETSAPDFDPADHKADEVVAYLADHPEDADRVKTLEAEARKPRKTILSYEAASTG